MPGVSLVCAERRKGPDSIAHQIRQHAGQREQYRRRLGSGVHGYQRFAQRIHSSLHLLSPRGEGICADSQRVRVISRWLENVTHRQ